MTNMIALLRAIAIFIVGVVVSIFIISSNPTIEGMPSDLPNGLTDTETSLELTDSQKESPAPNTEASNDDGTGGAAGTLKETVAQPEIPDKIVEEEGEANEPKIMIDTGVEIIDLTTELIELLTIPPVQEITLSTSELNTKIRDALVNIICTTKVSGSINPITGSGVIIDERGVIVTNAHIAQYYLLKDYSTPDFLDCTIRTGSPAVNAYRAELLFISSDWINDNYQKITQSNPKGTGENDFALLLITETTKPGTTLPDKFPFVAPDTREQEPQPKDSVIVASYPAGFLGGISIQKELYAVSTITQVTEVFTFKEISLDLFSVGGNIVAQKGSSGGGIVSTAGRLLGIVVTASEGTQTDDRDLRAITFSHINKSLKEQAGVDLNGYLFGGLLGKSIQFIALIAPLLTVLLESALNN